MLAIRPRKCLKKPKTEWPLKCRGIVLTKDTLSSIMYTQLYN